MKLLLKACCVGPGLVASTVLVSLVIGPALPDWAGICLFYCGLTVVVLLISGIDESHAVQVLCRARTLSEIERAGMVPVIAELCHLGLGPPVIDLFVGRRRGSPAAAAYGRRPVVVAPELIHGVMTRQLPHREAVAVLAHATMVARAGLARQDLAIIFWSTPWRAIATVARPLRGILGLAWKIRFPVFGVAIWQSLTTDQRGGSLHGTLHGTGIATALGCLLVLTYLVPRWSTQWTEYVTTTADRELLACGLGPAMAAFLRRFPQTASMTHRVRVLDPPATARPRFRLVEA